MSKIIFKICFYINVIFILLFLYPIFDFFLFSGRNLVRYDDNFILYIRTFMTIPVIALWIKTLIIWGKTDKSILRFFLLFFLIGIYTPFYYYKKEMVRKS